MKQVEIRVKGEINEDWSDWFGYLTITHAGKGVTVLTGSVQDQPELRAILSRLDNLGLELVSVNTKYEGDARISKKGGDQSNKRNTE
jgi:hypothetical protein